ncbi:MAG: GAF domain-containing protein [Acidobacteria bacterium]|nr:GAF domain-containing protein [Acidobacteriota bacterium]MBV9624933.1 GAF domain-containing protein [Acidobacteriota bacterium]
MRRSSVNQSKSPAERRHSLRQRINSPAFASFDGVTGGMILDLSEQGMSMAALAPLEAHSVRLSLGEPATHLETTGYVAWADALARAGVRFSDLPGQARARLHEWLTSNGSAPSWKAPTWIVRDIASERTGSGTTWAINVEPASRLRRTARASTSVQYEFKSLGSDLNLALSLIATRACSITRGTGAAVALMGDGGMTCRAVAGSNVPNIGTPVDIGRGFTGECIRRGQSLRCDDAQSDPHADHEACRNLDIRSILAAPIRYERDDVGLLEVFSSRAAAFDDGDLAVVERLAQTVVLTLSRAEAFRQS